MVITSFSRVSKSRNVRRLGCILWCWSVVRGQQLRSEINGQWTLDNSHLSIIRCRRTYQKNKPKTLNQKPKNLLTTDYSGLSAGFSTVRCLARPDGEVSPKRFSISS